MVIENCSKVKSILLRRLAKAGFCIDHGYVDGERAFKANTEYRFFYEQNKVIIEALYNKQSSSYAYDEELDKPQILFTLELDQDLLNNEDDLNTRFRLDYLIIDLKRISKGKTPIQFTFNFS